MFMTPVSADTHMDIMLGSYHTNRNVDFNESNTGMGLSYIDGALMLSAGQYNNSYNDSSFYAMAGYRYYRDSYEVGVLAGPVTGYEIGSLFAAMPFVAYKITPNFKINIMYVAKTEHTESALFAFSVSLKL
jgi:hypothetical protein